MNLNGCEAVSSGHSSPLPLTKRLPSISKGFLEGLVIENKENTHTPITISPEVVYSDRPHICTRAHMRTGKTLPYKKKYLAF